jgi:beta-glucosidase
MSEFLSFPSNFLWGAATSPIRSRGRGRKTARASRSGTASAHTPGNIIDGSNGDVACDHYHRWPEDIALMKSLGLHAYRFSIAWPRILPTGAASQPGRPGLLQRLVDGLLEARHQALCHALSLGPAAGAPGRGGWPARFTAEAFVEYADVVSLRLGDRVTNWITHNEPWCVSFLSHQIGEHAPGCMTPGRAAARTTSCSRTAGPCR